MSIYKEILRDYKITAETLREERAKLNPDKKVITRLCEDLVRLADAMERNKY